MTVLAPALKAPSPDVQTELHNPYPGLRSFVEKEADLFFGREREIAAVLELLEQQQLVVVHGASGCGKSSVVRAGVVPVFRLDSLANDAKAHVIIIRPADADGPLASLARKLEREFPRHAPPLAVGSTSQDRERGAQSWSEVLAASPDLVRDVSEATRAAGATLCLIIDQFEEIFAINRSGYGAEARRLVEFLVSLGEPAEPGTALGDRPLSVILTMRSDYLGQCALWDGFAEAVNRCQYLLPRMSTLGVLRAIHEPARLRGGEVTADAADRLLPVMSRETDGLPILQHALMRAWEAAEFSEGPPIIHPETFDLIGGVDHALSRHADEAFAKATHDDPALEEAANWLFRSLSDLDTDGRVIRRSVRLGDLPVETGATMAEIRSILDVFRAPEFSLLTPYAPEPLEDGAVVSVSHEALLRQWYRINDQEFERGRPKGLIYREVQDGLIARALSVQAEDYASNALSVLGPAATEQRLPWFEELRKRPGWIARYPLQRAGDLRRHAQDQWDKLEQMMAASKANLDVEKARLKEMQSLVVSVRRSRSLILTMSSLILMMIITLLFGIFLFYRNELASQEKKIELQRILDLKTKIMITKARADYRTAIFLANRECAGVNRKNEQCHEQVANKYMKLLYPAYDASATGSVPVVPYYGFGGGLGHPTAKVMK